MNKLVQVLCFSFLALFISNIAHANHCSGGHKEIKETKETSSEEESKEAKSN